jgi:phosphate transport system substrate-binding protein
MSKWTKEYYKGKGVEVNYQSVGSGAGIQQMTKKTVNFGCSDAPMNDEQLQEAKKTGGDVVHIPLVMGGVVPAYNLPDVPKEKPLNFTGEVLGDILLGKIKKWNEKPLKDLNKDVELPNKEIIVIHRQDPSGTTYIFLDFLAKTSKRWKEKFPKPKTSIEWPKGPKWETGQGSEGMAATLSTPYSLGYVELDYVLKKKDISYGAVQNQEKEFVRASLDSVTNAAKGLSEDLPEDLRYSLTNAPGKGAYPICGTTWAILFQEQPDGKGQELKEFLKWVINDGQKDCADLKYASLPEPLKKRIEKKLESIKFKK